MFATNERDARAAYHCWLGQGPSGPYAIDFIEAMTDKEGEMMEHLAAFMFRAGVEFKEHVVAFETAPQFQVVPSAADPLGTGVPLSGIVVPPLGAVLEVTSTTYRNAADPLAGMQNKT